MARDPVTIKRILIDVENSLVQQSFQSAWHPGFTQRNNANLNGDGLGLGWYSLDKPFLYKSVEPAWSDFNLGEISSSIESAVIFGHVRAASPGSVVSRENCHPFRFGRLLFQHNGHIEQFHKIKRSMINLMTDAAYLNIKGVTDSEYAFALLVSKLPDASRTTPFSPLELETALTETIERLLDLLSHADVVTGFTSLNFALTDGNTVIATRFCDNWPDIPPPSLYFCYERIEDPLNELGKCNAGGGPGDGSEQSETLARPSVECPATIDDAYTRKDERWKTNDAAIADASKDPALRALIVGSEPMTKSSKLKWYPIPANTMMVYTRCTEFTDGRSRPAMKDLVFDSVNARRSAKLTKPCPSCS